MSLSCSFRISKIHQLVIFFKIPLSILNKVSLGDEKECSAASGGVCEPQTQRQQEHRAGLRVHSHPETMTPQKCRGLGPGKDCGRHGFPSRGWERCGPCADGRGPGCARPPKHSFPLVSRDNLRIDIMSITCWVKSIASTQISIKMNKLVVK